jgi:RimJ/RimL family protein N-acetyltransferase
MRHGLRLSGRRFALRPADPEDAGFILSLRTDPELSRFLHPTSAAVADQLAWMRAYEQRPGDYYFIVTDERSGGLVGTIGIYDLAEGAGEWGRWLIRPDSLAAVESALLIYRLGFEQLKLDRLYCRTLADNGRVVSFHDSMGADRVRTIEAYAALADGMHDAVEHQVTRDRWEPLRPRLERLAQRVAET